MTANEKLLSLFTFRWVIIKSRRNYQLFYFNWNAIKSKEGKMASIEGKSMGVCRYTVSVLFIESPDLQVASKDANQSDF